MLVFTIMMKMISQAINNQYRVGENVIFYFEFERKEERKE